MSGHSKWSTIKRKKAKTDQERGKIFGRLIREITVAARHGGGDVEGNPRLRTAVQAAKAANMPVSNIERAIAKGSGADGGQSIEEMTYEGYGPGGVAVLVDVMTDNKNRTAAEIRHLFSKGGGRLGENGCVAWKFELRGSILVDRSASDEETLLEIGIEAGATDVGTDQPDVFEVVTEPTTLHQVSKALESRSVAHHDVQLTRVATSTVDIEDESTANKVLKLMDALEDHDDVQAVWSDFDISDEIVARLSTPA
jgi:YebC/PmpR family DNA-binding regulatory protein